MASPHFASAPAVLAVLVLLSTVPLAGAEGPWAARFSFPGEVAARFFIEVDAYTEIVLRRTLHGGTADHEFGDLQWEVNLDNGDWGRWGTGGAVSTASARARAPGVSMDAYPDAFTRSFAREVGFPALGAAACEASTATPEVAKAFVCGHGDFGKVLERYLESQLFLSPGRWVITAAQASSPPFEGTTYDISLGASPRAFDVRFTSQTGYWAAHDLDEALNEQDAHASARALGFGAAASWNASRALHLDQGLFGLAYYTEPRMGFSTHEYTITGPHGEVNADGLLFLGEAPGDYRLRLNQAAAGHWGRAGFLYANFPPLEA